MAQPVIMGAREQAPSRGLSQCLALDPGELDLAMMRHVGEPAGVIELAAVGTLPSAWPQVWKNWPWLQQCMWGSWLPQAPEGQPCLQPFLVPRKEGAASLLWPTGFPPEAIPVTGFLTPVLLFCLLAAKSSPLPQFAFQMSRYNTQPHAQQWTHVSGWDTVDLHRTLSCLYYRPVAPETPPLSQPISPPRREIPWMQEPPLSFNFPASDAGPVLPLLFLFPFSFILPSYLGNFSCIFRCSMYSTSVQSAL